MSCRRNDFRNDSPHNRATFIIIETNDEARVILQFDERDERKNGKKRTWRIREKRRMNRQRIDSSCITRFEMYAGPRERVSLETRSPKWILAFRLIAEIPSARRYRASSRVSARLLGEPGPIRNHSSLRASVDAIRKCDVILRSRLKIIHGKSRKVFALKSLK